MHPFINRQMLTFDQCTLISSPTRRRWVILEMSTPEDENLGVIGYEDDV